VTVRNVRTLPHRQAAGRRLAAKDLGAQEVDVMEWPVVFDNFVLICK